MKFLSKEQLPAAATKRLTLICALVYSTAPQYTQKVKSISPFIPVVSAQTNNYKETIHEQ
jgi:hypothetical protein